MAMSFRDYAAAMYGCYSTMPDEEREALHAWEAEHLDGSGTYGSSDWPGWHRYIGKFQVQPVPSRDTFGSVYLIQSDAGHCKIGSSQSVSARLKQLQCANAGQLSVIHQFEAADALREERRLHAAFAHRRIRNEWFALTDSDIAWIRTTCAQGDSPGQT